VQLIALITVRKLMDYFFYTQQDLSWLDHLLPEDDRRKAEDEGNKLECGVQLVAPQKRPVMVSFRSFHQSFIIVLHHSIPNIFCQHSLYHNLPQVCNCVS